MNLKLLKEQGLTKEFIEKEILDSSGSPNANNYKKLKKFNLDKKDRIKILYMIYYNLSEESKCPVCGNEVKFVSFKDGFKKYCSIKCKRKENPIKLKSNYKSYSLEYVKSHIDEFVTKKGEPNFTKLRGVNDIAPFRSKSEMMYCFLKGMIEPPKCLCGNYLKFLSFDKGYEQYCGICAYSKKIINEKREQTNLKKYGKFYVMQVDEIKEKNLKAQLKNGGIGFQNPKVKEKVKKKLIEKYGVPYVVLTEEQQRKRVESIRNNSTQQNKWVFRYDNIKPDMEKYKQTCMKKYGTEWYVQSEEFQKRKPEIVKKIWNTKKKNKTTNTSKIEDEIYFVLTKHFDNVKREYSSEKYPFSCDFYIKDLDLYIEYQGFFTHGFEAYFGDKDDLEQLKKWQEKAITSDFYKNALKIWTEKDSLKRKIAKQNKINLLEIFEVDVDNIEQSVMLQIERFFDLKLDYSKKELMDEFNLIKKKNGDLSKPVYNKIIKQYQQDVFYKKEKELYRDPVVRRKLIKNRKKYLKKAELELSNRELLSGFKISGLYNGYSFFSPLWFKFFIEKTGVKSVYDSTGGWGHRLLGGVGLDLYIYNDINTDVMKNCIKISNDFGIKNAVFYNNDMLNFEPKEDFESIFTCPPYINIKGDSSVDEEMFVKIIEKIFSFNKVVGLVLREDYEKYIPKYDEKFLIKNGKNHFGTKKINEFLYIFNKKN